MSNIYRRQFKSETSATEEMLERVVCSREQFSFQMWLESDDGSGTIINWRQRRSWIKQQQTNVSLVVSVYSTQFNPG